MHVEGIDPDHITFTNILSACDHAGLVNEGLELFVDIVSRYHIRPSMEHYVFTVDLLSRCGNLDDIVALILAMPYETDENILGLMLAACLDHSKIELAEYLSKHLRKPKPYNRGSCVAPSNGLGEVSTVRESIKEKGFRKNSECSWIQIGEELHVFVTGDGSHPNTEDIYGTLALLGMQMHY
ncbi:hypothetical protein CFOL_v3_09022 [Cephalotus follicularis]|uniref:Pentatricopeptide repeat-containing protein n=1 Tax=Cephalotus follicularis TaxID=3775 RepID=A0A1Q3BBT2_CEPFO|nr:hypothetical protein CFOL_v3_09022 [Cephalotus follicularis]